MVNNNEITKQLKILGVNEKEAEVYLALLTSGTLSQLEIARKTNINRTTVYRILEKLYSLGLAEQLVESKSTRSQAVNPEKIGQMIIKKESELEQIKSKLPDLINNLSQIRNTADSPTKVIYFKGKEGLEQLLWNTLKAEGKDEVVGYGYLDWNEGIGEKMADKLRQEYVDRKILSREIRNQKDTDFTNVSSYVNKNWVGRYLPKSKLEILHDTYIYNDVFAYYHFYEGEMFGVEIHNEEIAKTQKQIFEILWKQAKKI